MGSRYPPVVITCSDRGCISTHPNKRQHNIQPISHLVKGKYELKAFISDFFLRDIVGSTGNIRNNWFIKLRIAATIAVDDTYLSRVDEACLNLELYYSLC